MYLLLLLLISLQYVEKLFVGVGIIGITCFDLVEVLNSMIKFTGSGLLFHSVLVIEIPQKGSSGRCLWILRSRRVKRRGRIEMRGRGMMRDMIALWSEGTRQCSMPERWKSWLWCRKGISETRTHNLASSPLRNMCGVLCSDP